MRKKDLDLLIFRWKNTARALKIHEQPYGKYITDLLGKRTDAELALFTDPVEAAAFFCLLDLMKRSRPDGELLTGLPQGIPGQSPLVPVDRAS